MSKETYEKVIDFFEASPMRSVFLSVICRWLPFVCGMVYLVGAAGLAYMADERLFRYLLVPAGGFIFVTIFRKLVNRKRPYEALGFVPFLKYKEGKGQSFPSRHTASAFLIAMACFYICPCLGGVMLIVAGLIAASRVVSGMHYPSDVIFAIFVSLLIAVLGYYVV